MQHILMGKYVMCMAFNLGGVRDFFFFNFDVNCQLSKIY